MPSGYPIKKDKEVYRRMRFEPLFFIEKMWGITPQPIKQEYQDEVLSLVKESRYSEVKQEHFGPFLRGKHMTWQQWLMVSAITRAQSGEGKKRITVRSGHGIGKSAFLAWMLIWFLFCHRDAQIPCTAPTSAQLFDILWKETAKWLRKMPDWAQEKFEWQSEYIRLVERPETWFARARTGKKENPEALAGMHADYMLYLVDEASGVPDEIFNTAEGALTSDNIIFIMISNPTRLTGYFYESHNQDKRNWEPFHFSSLESPVVSGNYVARIADKHGTDSDEYRIRVMGEFPKAEMMDDKGFVPLFTKGDLHMTPNSEFVGKVRMGVDCAGEGDDQSVWVVRDKFKAKIVATEAISDAKSIAQRTLTLMEYYNVPPTGIYVDNFGEGANVAQELALAGKGVYCNAINVGDKPDDRDVYLNKRAEVYFRLKEWVRKGGELVNSESWEQLYDIKWVKNLSGKIKLMSKLEMRKQGIDSPDEADALALTFVDEDSIESDKEMTEESGEGWNSDFDPHSVI